MFSFQFQQQPGIPLGEQLDELFRGLQRLGDAGVARTALLGSSVAFQPVAPAPVCLQTGADHALLLADAQARAAGEDLDGSPRRETVPTDAPKRERGKAAPGRQRRTKEEMEEDRLADEADARAAAASGGLPGEAPQISTNPEDRIGPEDSPEVKAQDAADELAESQANAGQDLTLDNVRDAAGRYYAKFGMGPATADIRTMLGVPLVEIPDTQAAYRKAIDAIEAAISENPFGRAVVGTAPAASIEQPAASVTVVSPVTLHDLKLKMTAYCMAFGREAGEQDLPKMLGVNNVTHLSESDYAAKAAAVDAAIAGNPYSRTRVA